MISVRKLALCASALPIMAQMQVHGQTVPAEKDAALLDEIVVTARQRSENLLEVPDTISVIDSEVIERAGIANLGGIASMTANLNYMNYEQPGVVAVSIRGISNLRIGQPSVAFVIDGVTLYNPLEFSQSLYDVQQVEVLKGPQGALYGINSIGGAINITTKQPTNDIEGKVKFGYAEGNEFTGFTSISGPLVKDKVLFRMAVNYRNTDGRLKDVFNRHADKTEELGLRGRLIFNLADNLDLDLRGSYNDLSAGSFYFAPDQHFISPDDAVLGQISADVPQHAKRKVKGASAKLSWDFGFARLDNIAAWTKVEGVTLQDGDTTSLSVFEFHGTESARTLVDELRLTSPDDQRLRWIVGGTFMNSKHVTDTRFLLNLDGPLAGGSGDPATKNLSEVSRNFSDIRDDIYSVFAQINYDITRKLELTAALRYDSDKAEITRLTTGRQGDTFAAWQPKFSLAYKMTDDVMTYATFSKGFRAGGFNEVPVFVDEYLKEGTTNYEVGLKSAMFDRRLKLSLSGFYTEYKNQQFFIFDLATASQSLVNAPDSSIKGVEVQFSAKPVDGLDLNGSFGLLDTKIKSFPALPTSSVDTSLIPGKRIPLNTKYTLNLSAQYSAEVASGWDGVARIDFERRGKMYWQADNLDVQKAFNLVNLRAGVESDNLSVSVYAKNVFDKKYLENYFPAEWIGFIDLAYPSNNRRVLGVEVGYNF